MVDFGISGKTAYVTGGAAGIGHAIVEQLANSGARVAFSNTEGEGYEAARQKFGADIFAVAADLTDPGETEKANLAVSEWCNGSPDILINNVGRGSDNDFLEATDDDWNYSFQLNLMSHIRTTRHFLPAMSKSGAIINVASDLAKQPESVPVEYGAMKAALLHLTKNLAITYAPLRVNAVLPGPVWTPLWTRPGGLVDELAAKYGLDREAAVDRYLHDRHMPLGIADPEDVANLVLFLVSPLAKSITGAAVDLGGTIRGLI